MLSRGRAKRKCEAGRPRWLERGESERRKLGLYRERGRGNQEREERQTEVGGKGEGALGRN